MWFCCFHNLCFIQLNIHMSHYIEYLLFPWPLFSKRSSLFNMLWPHINLTACKERYSSGSNKWVLYVTFFSRISAMSNSGCKWDIKISFSRLHWIKKKKKICAFTCWVSHEFSTFTFKWGSRQEQLQQFNCTFLVQIILRTTTIIWKSSGSPNKIWWSKQLNDCCYLLPWRIHRHDNIIFSKLLALS